MYAEMELQNRSYPEVTTTNLAMMTTLSEQYL